LIIRFIRRLGEAVASCGELAPALFPEEFDRLLGATSHDIIGRILADATRKFLSGQN